ncbi:MAG: non-canonical purine NTP pyrophosphatase, RdgB/HAM1 family [Verrucomicrobia bacterium]|nr:MAG: non-canonical purine NTP pyrophosphatase, RdgB/HAM1 family [Verrucomicrobiota bacterium]
MSRPISDTAYTETGSVRHRILVATRNCHKLREFAELCGPNFEVCGMESISGVPQIEESGETFESNALIKAEFASNFFSHWVLADDSGLEVDALRGAPGVLSARFAGEKATDAENRRLLLRRLEKLGVRGKHRTARFRCALALAKSGKAVLSASGTVEGIIVESETGMAGFGYDPIFRPVGYSKTFAELASEIKNEISHRGRALRELQRAWVKLF